MAERCRVGKDPGIGAGKIGEPRLAGNQDVEAGIGEEAECSGQAPAIIPASAPLRRQLADLLGDD